MLAEWRLECLLEGDLLGGGLGPDEMWEQRGASLPETRRSGLAGSAQEKDTAAPAPSVGPQLGHPGRGTCSRVCCFLGNHTLTYPVVSTDDVVLLDCEARGFYCGHGERKQGMFPGRDLCPLFISASVRNLLGHVVANKKEIPDFNLTHGLWIFGCLSCPGWSHFDKSVFQSTGKDRLSLLGPGNVLRKWDQKRQISQNCLWESAGTKLATGFSS